MPLNLASAKPVVNTEGDANQIANGFTLIEQYVNGNIEPAGIKQTGATLGQALVWDGAKWAPATIVTATTYRSTALVDVTSSVAELDLVNFTIPANVLALDRRFHMIVNGDLLRNAAQTPTIRLYLGGTLMYSTAPVPASGAVRRRWRLEFDLENLGVANSQSLAGRFYVAQPDGTTVGAIPFQEHVLSMAPLALDSTAGIVVRVSGQWDLSAATLSIRRNSYWAEVV